MKKKEFQATKNLPYYFWHFRQTLPSTYCYFWILSNSPMWLFEIWACSSAHISLFQGGIGLERDIKEKGFLSNTLCRTSTITSGLKFGGLTGNKSALQPKSGPSFLDSRLSNWNYAFKNLYSLWLTQFVDWVAWHWVPFGLCWWKWWKHLQRKDAATVRGNNSSSTMVCQSYQVN